MPTECHTIRFVVHDDYDPECRYHQGKRPHWALRWLFASKCPTCRKETRND